MPNISIITTTYQHADFIAQTIESVLGQTYSDWEMLIGDDSPDDATWDVIQWYVDKYPTKIKARHHSPNKGIVDNMNFLIQQCDSQSDFISFLEGDDRYTADNLMEKIKIFEKYPEVQLVYSDFQVIDETGKQIDHFLQQSRIDQYFNKYHFAINPNNIFSWSNGMIRKDISTKYSIKNITNSPTYSVSDRDFYQHIISHEKIHHIPKKLLEYRKHKNNISFQNNAIGKDIHHLTGYYFSTHYRTSGMLLLYAMKNWRKIQPIRFIKVILTYMLGAKYVCKLFDISTSCLTFLSSPLHTNTQTS